MGPIAQPRAGVRVTPAESAAEVSIAPGSLYTQEPLRHEHVQYSIGAFAWTFVALGVRLAHARRAYLTCEDRTYGRHPVQFSPHHDRSAARRSSALLWQYCAGHTQPGPYCRWRSTF